MGGRAVAAVLTLAAACGGCGPFGDDVIDGSLGPLAKAVRESGRSGSAFRLTSATDFSWERVHVVGPYTPTEEISRELGFEWDDADESDIPLVDWFHLIVFVEDGRVVRAFEHDLGGGSFGCLAWPVVRGGLTPREAVFEVAESPAADDSSVEVFLSQPRNAREARRTERCVETYS